MNMPSGQLLDLLSGLEDLIAKLPLNDQNYSFFKSIKMDIEAYSYDIEAICNTEQTYQYQEMCDALSIAINQVKHGDDLVHRAEIVKSLAKVSEKLRKLMALHVEPTEPWPR